MLRRQDAQFDWLLSPAALLGEETHSLVTFVGDACYSARKLRSRVALAIDGGCSHAHKVETARRRGADALIIMARPRETLREIECTRASECADGSGAGVSATMVPFSWPLLRLLQLAESVRVRFRTQASARHFLAIDANGIIREPGWLLRPSLRHLVWQAEGMNFQKSIDDALKEAEHTVEIFDGTSMAMKGADGASKTLKLDARSLRTRFRRLLVELRLHCDGNLDKNCPEWDHLVHLFVCCQSTPDSSDMAMCGDDGDGHELARWVTPFRRKDGRWLSDASALMPLISADHCRFELRHPEWAQAWLPELRLHFSDRIGL